MLSRLLPTTDLASRPRVLLCVSFWQSPARSGASVPFVQHLTANGNAREQSCLAHSARRLAGR
eukprot:530104-Lingulodinium_polyedra.AAC.1